MSTTLTRTILLADDQKNIREYCRIALSAEGYRIVLARDGAEAIETFILESPDLAVLDVCMPRTSGLEALEQIKRLSPRTPVILFTAHREDCLGDRRAGMAAACIDKRDDLNELKLAVARTLTQPPCESGGESLRVGLPPFPAVVEHVEHP